MMQQIMADPAMVNAVTSQLQNAIAVAECQASVAGSSSLAASAFQQPPSAPTRPPTQTQRSQLSAMYTLLQQLGIQTTKLTLGQLWHQLIASMGQSSALMLAGGTGSPSHSNGAFAHNTHDPVFTMANTASRKAAAYSQMYTAGGPACGSYAPSSAANVVNEVQSKVQALHKNALPNSSGAHGGALCSIPQMDGTFADLHDLHKDDLRHEACLPQLDGADDGLHVASLLPPALDDLDRDLDLHLDLHDDTKTAHEHIELERSTSKGAASQSSESVRGTAALQCSACASNPYHKVCVEGSEFIEFCPSCRGKTVTHWSGEMACAAPITNLERAAGAEHEGPQQQVRGSVDADGSTPRLFPSASTWVGMPEADVAKLLVGVTIRKQFLQYGTFDGVVQSFDAKPAQFVVKYSDGDEEAMSLAQMAKWLPREYVLLAKEYLELGEGGKRRELQGAGRGRAIVGGKIARKEEKGKTNEGKDATESGGAAASQPDRAWISEFASTQQQGSGQSVLGYDSFHSIPQGLSMSKDRDNVPESFPAELHMKKRRAADEKAPAPSKGAVWPERQQEQMRLLIQHAAHRADTQQVVLSNQLIRLPHLLAAIREKGMENGNVVWVHVAVLLGINVKSCHCYSTKLLQLLEGSAPDDGQYCKVKNPSKNRSSADKSKGISKRPGMTGMVMPLSKKPKAPPMFIQRMSQSQAREFDKDQDQCTVRQDSHTTYVTLKLLTGVTLKDREDYMHVLPKRHKMEPRDGGRVAAHLGVRKAAQMAHHLWVQSIFDSVARCDSLQKRLKRIKVAKLTNGVGWDLSRLGHYVVAAAVGQGLLYWANSQLCSTNPKADHIAELGVLSDDRVKQIRRSLGQVQREINRDPRMCCLCRIVGDLGVQGRLLYVETNSWAHVSCLCWSKGVYETTMQMNIGKIGMLCNVHDLLQSARECLCDFCGCPGATVVCSALGHCSQSHFGCAVLKYWSFYAEGRVFCELCNKCPAAEACGGVSNSWAAIQMYRLTSRHLRVMPRNKPKLVESPLVCLERATQSSTSDTHKQAPFEQLADLAIVDSMMDAAPSTESIWHIAASAGASVDGAIKSATTAASASHSAKNRVEKSARAVEQAALEAVQREREEALNREQWDAYEDNLLSNIAKGMQSGSVMARIGSLTVHRLGKIKVDDDSYHSELAIYPVGYMSNRVCFAPGEIQSKSGVACRRAVYECQILIGHQSGAPLFEVTVENESFYAASASQAWELATRRSLRSVPAPAPVPVPVDVYIHLCASLI